MKCEKCQNEHNGKYGAGRFCSSACARSRGPRTKEFKESVSSKLSIIRDPIECLFCQSEFIPKRKTTQFCSRGCVTKYRLNHSRDFARKGGRKSAKGQKRRSKNEIAFFELCKNRFDSVEHNIPKFNGWDADVIINDLQVAVLWNGPWHYKKITEKHSLEQVQNRDRLKVKEIEKAGWSPYIIKDMGKHNPEFVKEQFDKFIQTV